MAEFENALQYYYGYSDLRLRSLASIVLYFTQILLPRVPADFLELKETESEAKENQTKTTYIKFLSGRIQDIQDFASFFNEELISCPPLRRLLKENLKVRTINYN